MKWGVRKKRDGVQSTLLRGPDGKISGPGLRKGQDFTRESHDSVSARQYRKQVNKFGTAALSNKEMKAMLDRMDLEKRHRDHDFNKKRESYGKKTTKLLMKRFADRRIQEVEKIGDQYIMDQTKARAVPPLKRGLQVIKNVGR
jgi:hypothetical protein